jgi:hypothetical protein
MREESHGIFTDGPPLDPEFCTTKFKIDFFAENIHPTAGD